MIPEIYNPRTERWHHAPELNEQSGIMSRNPKSITDKVVRGLKEFGIHAYDSGDDIRAITGSDDLSRAVDELKKATCGTEYDVFEEPKNANL